LGFQCPADVKEVAKCAADHGTYIELNSKKTHLTDEELYAVVQTGVRFVIDSDAHSVSRIGDTKLVEEQLKRVDVPLDRIDNIDGRMPVFRFSEYKKHM
jgi:putative hydrolase